MAVVAPKKQDWNAALKTKINARPHATIIAGVPGVGKTEFAAQFKDNLFVNIGQEDGISQLKASGRVPEDVIQVDPSVKTYEELCDLVDWLTAGDHKFKRVTFDVLSGIQSLIYQFHANKHYNGVVGADFIGFKKGAKEAFEIWKQFIDRINKMREKAGVAVIFLSHSSRETVQNLNGANYDRYTLDVSPDIAGFTIGWADNVFFMDYLVDVSVGKSDGASFTKKGKASSFSSRVMYVDNRPAFPCKHRLNFTEDAVDMGNSGAESYAKFIEEARKKPAASA